MNTLSWKYIKGEASALRKKLVLGSQLSRPLLFIQLPLSRVSPRNMTKSHLCNQETS